MLEDRGTAYVTHGGLVVGADLSGRRLEQFSSDGTRFEHCRFDGMSIESAGFGEGLKDSVYVDCSFDGAKLVVGPVGFARFERCSFQRVRIREWFGHAVELVDCVFSGQIKGGWLSGAVPTELVHYVGRAVNEIRGNDFSKLRLLDFGFRTGVDLRAQRLPQDPEYVYIEDLAKAVARGRRSMLSESDLDLRRKAFVFLQMWEQLAQGGQRQALLREKDYPRVLRPAFRRLVEVMTRGD